MLATIGKHLPTDSQWVFEQKYDGMRVIAGVDARRVRLVTRNGRDKAKQFPEIVDALRELGRRLRRPLVLDGEIVAVKRRRSRAVSVPSATHATRKRGSDRAIGC